MRWEELCRRRRGRVFEWLPGSGAVADPDDPASELQRLESRRVGKISIYSLAIELSNLDFYD